VALPSCSVWISASKPDLIARQPPVHGPADATVDARARGRDQAVPGQPLAGAAQADPGLCRKGLELHAPIEMPTNQAFPTERRQLNNLVGLRTWAEVGQG